MMMIIIISLRAPMDRACMWLYMYLL